MARRKLNGILYAGMVFVFILAVLMLVLAGCRAPQPVVITQRDSTHTETITTYRDTTVIVPGDQAVLKVGSDVLDIRRLVDDLRGEVRTIRGANQAVLELRATNDTLTVTALCNELQLRLDSVLVRNTTLTHTVSALTSFIAQEPGQPKPMPAWAKGVATVAGSVAVALLVAALVIKLIFKQPSNGTTGR